MKKFDFKPMQWVLVRDCEETRWVLAQFSNMDGRYYVVTGGMQYAECIPYKGNKHLLGTTNPYVEKYEPKDGDFVTFVAYVSKIKFTAICQNYISCSMLYYVGTIGRERNEIQFNNAYSLDSRDVVKPATEDEKNELLSNLHKIGKDWNKETKQIVAYNPPYEPKDGDFVVMEEVHENGDKAQWVFIFKSLDSRQIRFYVGLDTLGNMLRDAGPGYYARDGKEKFRITTEEERLLLLSKLRNIGKDWDAENKEVVDWKWKPNIGDNFFTPCLSFGFRFVPYECKFEGLSTQKIRAEKGYIYRTREECQAMCDKLNEAIKDVK